MFLQIEHINPWDVVGWKQVCHQIYLCTEGDECRHYLIGMNFLWWRCDVVNFDCRTFIDDMTVDSPIENVFKVI